MINERDFSRDFPIGNVSNNIKSLKFCLTTSEDFENKPIPRTSSEFFLAKRYRKISASYGAVLAWVAIAEYKVINSKSLSIRVSFTIKRLSNNTADAGPPNSYLNLHRSSSSSSLSHFHIVVFPNLSFLFLNPSYKGLSSFLKSTKFAEFTSISTVHFV